MRFGADDHNIGAIDPLAGSAVLDCRDSAKKHFTEYETSPPLPNFRYHATLMPHKRFDTIRAGAPHRQGTRTVMLDPDVKQRVIEEYRTHETDTGSTELQVAMLTERIRQVTDHLRTHRKDVHSRRGLVTMVSKRRRLLNYLSREDVGRYQSLIGRLGLRR